MKKLLAFIVVITLLLLAACGNGTLEESSAAETTTQAETASIVFMSEVFETPASYRDAPAEYKPVLDDLYLMVNLYRRYLTLLPEGKETNGTRAEMDYIEEEIKANGFIDYPYGVYEGNAGYAVADINNDGIPELLILEKHSYDDQLTIHAICTIRNHKAVPVIVDAFWLSNNTILATDGTFYRVEGYHNAGCADIYSYKLDAGAVVLTKLTEYRATLVFSEGPDVPPVPRWYKVVDGEEEEITEKEFGELEVKYRKPGKQKELAFIPIDATQAFPVEYSSSTAAPSEIQPIVYPGSYRDAPEAYKPVLDQFYAFSQALRNDEENAGYLSPFAWGVGYAGLAYAVKDINGDGVQELLLLTDEYPDNPNMALYTLKDGEPVGLDVFGYRYRGHLAADGTIYTSGSSGAAYTHLTSLRLKSGAAELTQLTEYHSDHAEFAYYFSVVDGRNQYITRDEFLALWDKYENPPNCMKLRFIPIEQ